MAFTIYHSNHLDSLQKISSYLIQQDPLDNPLSPEYFIIHSSGMTNWLKSALAEEHNIFANTRLEFPINQIVTMIEDLLTEEERAQTNLRISRLTLTWAVFDVLNSSSLDDLEILEQYLDSDTAQHADVRIMSLAEEIAGLFDKYLAYRPDWFEKWQSNQLVFTDSSDEAWQQKIWQEIFHKVMPKYYLANIMPLLKQLPVERYQKSTLPKRLFIIGISTLPPLFIELLHTLSEHIDVHLFFTNPSQFYWGDLTQYRQRTTQRIIFNSSDNNEVRDNLFSPNINESDLSEESEVSEQWLEFHGNPLLASFGKIGRDFIHLLSQYDDLNELEIFSEPDTQGLLGYIQKEVYNLSAVQNGQDKYVVSNEDESISFHSHYSERREVEGLYDHLLRAFNDDSEVEPKDIIVMVSDIDRYRPMIEAVFGSPFSPEAKIPFTISDFTLGKNEPILEAFLMLLSISDSQFSASELLTLLEIPEIALKFNIEQSDRELIRKWIDHTNIKFGIDNKHLSELKIREDFTNTWLWGLKRLLLGYSFNESVEIDDVVVFPYIQGGEAIILGRLVDFVDALIELKEKLNVSYELEEWREVLSKIWSTFYVDNDEMQSRLLHLQSIWNGFLDEGINIAFKDKISIHLIQRYINEHLSSFRPESRFLTGSVNFCTFIPMRSIPFKIVCMLGINQDSFPHHKQYPDYDLMQEHPERGDRSTVNDERYLFLEAILSAKSQLYISYIGKNIHNNSEMFPSLFVNELQHYIEEIAETENELSVTQQLTINHPLSPFSPSLFDPSSKIHSFQREWLPTAHDLDETAYHPEQKEITQVSCQELLNTFKDPLKYFSKFHFGINFYQDNINEIEDDELFSMSEVGNLERYNAHLQLLEALFYNDVPDDLLHDYARNELFEQYKAEGKLPKFAFAKLDWYSFVEPMLQMALEARSINYDYGAERQVNLKIDNIQITGTVLGNDSDHQCLVFVSKLNTKRKFTMLITHVLNTLRLGRNITTTIYNYEDKTMHKMVIDKISIEMAQSFIRQLLIGYRENLAQPFLLAAEGASWGKKLLSEHMDFVDQNYHDFCPERVKQYLDQNTEFKTTVIDKLLNHLGDQSSMIIDRFIESVSEKEVIGYLYFYQHYINLYKFPQRKKLK